MKASKAKETVFSLEVKYNTCVHCVNAV